MGLILATLTGSGRHWRTREPARSAAGKAKAGPVAFPRQSLPVLLAVGQARSRRWSGSGSRHGYGMTIFGTRGQDQVEVFRYW